MRSIRISRTTARVLLAHLEHFDLDHSEECRVLRAALAPKPRKSLPFVPRKKAKAAKKKTKRERTAEVYAAVYARANGICECGCNRAMSGGLLFAPTMDHFRGRAREESVESCWMLAWAHHEDKTNERPSRAEWLRKFIKHCDRWGYSRQAAKPRAELEADAEIEQAAALSKGLP